MRLIDVKTLELKEFFHNIPPYAILSHTWGDEEVTYQEYLLATGHDAKKHAHIKRKAGFSKILGACKRAQADKLAYLWCDTNCIDKSSSAELSEAINSMYAWYYNSVVCYAFLADVSGKSGEFEKSRWFTRGWTLQELVAPKVVVFFDRSWRPLGDRSAIAQAICKVTRIHIRALKDRDAIWEYSVAQKMSWAAHRLTSRTEDIAYCLLGIFGVNMPLLYGEGTRAFTRLQEFIIQKLNDQSILVWDDIETGNQTHVGILAPSPMAFRNCGSIVQYTDINEFPCSVTSLGISICPPVIHTQTMNVVLIGLNCALALQSAPKPNGTTPAAQQTLRKQQIWITLHHVAQTSYLRHHHISPRIILSSLYAPLSRPQPSSIFLIVNPTLMLGHGAQNIVSPFRKGQRPLDSGIHVMVSAGRLSQRSPLLSEIYPLGDISCSPLRSRGHSVPSHLHVTNNRFSIIISTFWNEVGVPQQLVYTAFVDPKMQVSRKLAEQSEWACFFNHNSELHSVECCKRVQDVNFLHSKLNRVVGLPATELHEGPRIIRESENLYDLLDRPEVLVSVTFRDKKDFGVR